MTRDYTDPRIVRLSVGNWLAITALTFTVLATFVGGSMSIERRLTEVITRQEQLQVRIERIEEQIDRQGDSN